VDGAVDVRGFGARGGDLPQLDAHGCVRADQKALDSSIDLGLHPRGVEEVAGNNEQQVNDPHADLRVQVQNFCDGIGWEKFLISDPRSLRVVRVELREVVIPLGHFRVCDSREGSGGRLGRDWAKYPLKPRRGAAGGWLPWVTWGLPACRLRR